MYRNDPQPILTLKFQAPDGEEFERRCTPGHRLYVRNLGFEHAETIPLGSVCRNAEDEDIVLVSRSLDPERVPVYNFQVEGAHTYYVGDSTKRSVLTHNQECATIEKESKPQIFYIFAHLNTGKYKDIYDITKIQNSMNKILAKAEVNLRIHLVITDHPISAFGQMGYHSNWDYSYVKNSTWYGLLHPFWTATALTIDAYNWLNREDRYFECYIRFSDKTGLGAIGSNMNGSNPVIYIPSLEEAKKKFSKAMSSEDIIANVLLHEIIFHGILGKMDMPWHPSGTLFHGISSATKPVEITAPQAVKIKARIN